MASITTTPPNSAEKSLRGGLLAGLAAYGLWGFLPIVFKLLEGVPSATIVADRTIWSLVLVGAILVVAGRAGEIRAAFRDGATVRSMLISSLLLAVNWLIYVWAVETGQLLEASFGYFVNPLVNVAIGMAFLGERQNRWQALSIAIAVVAIAIQAIGIGGVPYIALGLAVTFAGYGYFRKTAKVSSTTGLFVETLLLLPLAAGYLIFTFLRDGGIGPHADPYFMGMLLLTGPATAVPLLLFAFAVQRLRLTTIGMLQYIAPSIAFLLAITLFGEHLNVTRLLSFGLIWLSLAVYTTDSYLRRRGRPASTAGGA
ncbi:MAG: EamA family transporter RarD [Devosia sp.]|nr:EamA family transporter RarD [Devosia sp.]